MLKYIIVFVLHTFCFFVINGQASCDVCPPNSSVQLTHDYGTADTYLWTCTDGFTSTLSEPTFTPASDVTCNLLVTDNAGCTATSTVEVNVCECECNENMCINSSYNATTECVTFSNTGTPCSPISTESRQYKNISNGSWVNIPVNNEICDCAIRERLNTSGSVTVNGGNFRLTVTGLLNRCAPCTAISMNIITPVSGYGGNISAQCAGDTEWFTISPTNFANGGYVADMYVRYVTDWGTVVNLYRYSYNGNGLNAANVSVQEIYKKSIYKEITTRRVITYTDGCTQTTCENTLVIPQQPNDPCVHFVGFVSNVNLGSPCNAEALNASTINAGGTLTYQWKYNNVNISGETSQQLCMTGRPSGTYCVVVTSSNGCVLELCRIVQPPCSLNVTVASSGNILTATLINCTGTITRQWQRWNGTSWVNVGTNSNTYDTGGLAGDYRINVTCSGPPICNAIGSIVFTPPCTANVTLSNTSPSITANVTGCLGSNIIYTWQRWNGTSWVFISTNTTTSTSQSITPTVSGLHRVSITCNGCSAQATLSFTIPNPCTGFSTTMTGTFTNMCVGSTRTLGRSTTGGTAPFTQVWLRNGVNVGTGTSINFNPTVTGTYTFVVTVTDALGCTFTDTRNITVINCCAMSLSIAPTTLSVCQNQDASFTTSQTGGSAPITYSWTSQLPPSGPIGQGGGSTKILNFGTVGTYTVQVTATDNTGCTSQATASLSVTSCINCICTPTLNLNGCVLNGAFTGAGCGNFNYQLQYSPTGSGWTSVADGAASSGGTITHTPTANGVYRLVIFSGGCQGSETPLVSVSCYQQTCANPPLVTLNGTLINSCGINPITITGNTFGGSATNVTLSENGAGTISPTSVTTSPFSFTYTPTTADYGSTVTIAATTNNPLGSPCTPDVKTLGITVNPIPSPIITSSNSNLCVGQSRTITTNISGGTLNVSGPATLSGTTITATGIGTIIVSYSVTSLGCTGTAIQNIIVEECPCQGLTMSITPVTGGLSFGTLNFNGVPQTNYQIQWRKCSDNSVVITSGMGTGGGSGIFPHPSNNIPLVGDCYYAFIVFSPQGNNLDCFPDVTVANWTCANPPTYTYNGPGGAAATREFRMDIAASTSIRVGSFETQTVPDNLEVIYNGVTLYSDLRSFTLNQRPSIIPITYVSGVNFVTFRVTNSTPAQNTIWSIGSITCCPSILCPLRTDLPAITNVTANISTTNCGCTFAITRSPYTLTCTGCGLPLGSGGFSAGACVWNGTFTDNTCVNETVVITKPSAATRSFDFTSSTNYNYYKGLIQATSTDQRLSIQFGQPACGSDGTVITYIIMPFHHTIVYDDVNFIITITVSSTNPFPNNCTNCNAIKFSQYNAIYSIFNGTANIGTYMSIRAVNRAQTNQSTVNSIIVSTTINCEGGNCPNVNRPYRISYRDTSCPCQSWQLFEDTDNNGTYETLILEAQGWNGTCQ